MLSLCLPEEHKHNPPADLLEQCLKGVLDISNQENSGDNLRGCLTNYLKERCGSLFVPPAANFSLRDLLAPSNPETKGYKPLVQAFNHALEDLRKIDVPLLRKSTCKSTDLLLFLTNDPKNTQSAHHGKPDLLLVTLGVVAKGDASSHAWADYAFGKADEVPIEDVKWDDCLSTVKIKWTKGLLRTKQLRGRYDAVKPATPNHSLPKAEDDNGSQSIGHSQSVHSPAVGQYSQSPVVGQSQSVQPPPNGNKNISIRLFSVPVDVTTRSFSYF
jgi:hypothetical protein